VQIRRNIGEREEHEIARGHAGVRQLEGSAARALAAVYQQIEIDHAWSPLLMARGPAETSFKRQQISQQFV
jgi:hypothetical protein